jgi:hypothetical protein
VGKLLETAGITAFVAAIFAAAVWKIVSELNDRYFKRQNTAVLLVTLASLLFASLLLTLLENPLSRAWQKASGKWAYENSRDRGGPLVIGIYPEEAFGPLHRRGLNFALRGLSNELQVVSLTASLKEMKTNTGRASQVLTDLRRIITTKNVVAVVGPSVTEFTGPVINTVELTGRRPPVFITSAAPKEPVGWTSAKIPLFRINSGVDERAKEFVQLARTSIRQGVPLLFLVEQSENSSEKLYGQLVFEGITRDLPEWGEWAEAGKISVIHYTRGDIDSIASTDIEPELDRPRVVMLLGLGGDYKVLVSSFYKASDRPRLAMLGGWMNAFDVKDLFRNGAYQWQRLFEITDIDLQSRRPFADQIAFTRQFGQLTPPIRDQAFSYDAGRIIAKLFREVRQGTDDRSAKPTIDGKFLARLVDRIRNYSGTGVTGPIRFDPLTGQNIGLMDSQRRLMTFAQFDGSEWKRLSGPAAILMLAKRPATLTVPRPGQ